jgi:hypothetical protein
MTGRHAFGGTITTVAFAIVLAALCTFGIYKSWTSIRRLEIDQHRVWVLRTWSYAGSVCIPSRPIMSELALTIKILSLRVFILIFLIVTSIISPDYKSVITCAEIESLHHLKYNKENLQEQLALMYQRYPACVNSTASAIDIYVVVDAKTESYGNHPEEVTVLLNLIFGACGFVGLIVNILAVESYLNSTRDEDERLKRISSARRKAVELDRAGKLQ